jgi:hypothetical protein
MLVGASWGAVAYGLGGLVGGVVLGIGKDVGLSMLAFPSMLLVGGMTLGLAIGTRSLVRWAWLGALGFLWLFFPLAFALGDTGTGGEFGIVIATAIPGAAANAILAVLGPSGRKMRDVAIMALAGAVGFVAAGFLVMGTDSPFKLFETRQIVFLVKGMLIYGLVVGALTGGTLGYLQDGATKARNAAS